MRYLDELLALYTGKDPFTRKFILAQLLDQAPDSHSDQVVELLWSESRDADAIVRRQARYSLGQYLPAHAAFTYGLGGAAHAFPLTSVLSESRPAHTLAAGAAIALPGVVERVLARLDNGSSIERVAASLVLGRINTPVVTSMLRAAVDRAELSYMSAFSLAETGEESAVESLVAAAHAHGRTRPDLYMLLRGLPCAATFECLASEEDRTDSAGRANIALALSHFASAQSRPILERLVRRREGWVSAYVLDTLAGHGDPQDLPIIKLAYELEQHDFIRLQAVRAAGGIRTEASRDFCLEALASASPRVQSGALESLASQDIAPSELARIAEPYLTAEFARTRVHAMLAVSRHDPDRATEMLTQIILAPEALLRLEGAFITGYLRAPGGLTLLERMATNDPGMAVRMQAVKSIALWPVQEALPVLMRLLETPQRPILMTVCRALTGLERPGAVVVALGDGIGRLPTVSARAAALRAMGMSARLAERPPPGHLVDALGDADTLVKIGALEGLKYFGDAIPVEHVRPLLAHADARVRSRAAMLAFLAGYPHEAAALEPMLGASEEGHVLEALNALLELASVLPHIERGGFTRLRDALMSSAPPAPGPLPLFSFAFGAPQAGEGLQVGASTSGGAGPLAGAPASVAGTPTDAVAPPPAPPRPPRPTSKTRPVPSLRKAELLVALSGAHASVKPDKLPSKDVAGLTGAYADQNREHSILGDSATSLRLPSIAVPQPQSAPDFGGKSGVVQRPVRAAPAASEKPSATTPTPAPGASGARRAAVVATVLVAGVAAGVISRVASDAGDLADPTKPAASATIAQRTAIRVWSVTGACGRVGADGKPQPLAVGSYLKPGDRVSTEASGRLQVRFQDGSAVHLGPASHITAGAAVERSDRGALPAVTLDEPGGDIQLEAKVTELHVHVGGAVYRTKSGKARILARGTDWKVEQQEGDGTLLQGADRQVLVAGQSAPLPVGVP